MHCYWEAVGRWEERAAEGAETASLGKQGTLLNCWENFAHTECWKRPDGDRTEIRHLANDSNTFIAKGLQNRQSNLFQLFDNVP